MPVKKPRTSYNHFFHQERIQIQSDMANKLGRRPHYTEVSKMVAARWKRLSQSEKAVYQEMAAKDKRRYAMDLIRSSTCQQNVDKQQKLDGATNSDNTTETNIPGNTSVDSTLLDSTCGHQQTTCQGSMLAQLADLLQLPQVAQMVAATVVRHCHKQQLSEPTGRESECRNRGVCSEPLPLSGTDSFFVFDEDHVELLEDIFQIRYH